MEDVSNGFIAAGRQSTVQTDDMIAHLQRDVAAGNAQAISVDLAVLEGFYRQLWDLHDHIQQVLDQTASHNVDSLGIVEGIDEADGQRRIHGVVSAVRTARHAATGHEHGLHEVLVSVRNQVSKNLRALYDCYEAYNNTDLDGKDQLDAALTRVANAHYR